MVDAHDAGRRQYGADRRPQSDTLAKALVIALFFVPSLAFLAYVAWRSLGWASFAALAVVLLASGLVYWLAARAPDAHQPDRATEPKMATDPSEGPVSDEAGASKQARLTSTEVHEPRRLSLVDLYRLRAIPAGATTGAAIAGVTALNGWPWWALIGSSVAASAIVAVLDVHAERSTIHSMQVEFEASTDMEAARRRENPEQGEATKPRRPD
jgi:hypothetical protein